METKNDSQTLSVGVIGTGGDDAVEFISKSLSSSNCRLQLPIWVGGMYPISTSSRGAAVHGKVRKKEREDRSLIARPEYDFISY
jgi:hypothetical protein